MTGIKLDTSVSDPKVKMALEQIVKQSEWKLTELEDKIKQLEAVVAKQRIEYTRLIESLQ